MGLVGPGAIQEVNEDIKPMLFGVSEYEYVTVMNPLTDDFAVRVAQDIPVNMPFQLRQDQSGKTSALTVSEQDARHTYGLNLKNPDFQGRRHIVNSVIIKSGQTMNLKGNEAQVAVNQIVTEYLQRAGERRMVADPTKRHEVEKMIIKGRGSINDLLEGNFQTAQQQINQAISQSNEVTDEPAFPTVQRTEENAAGSGSGGTENTDVPRRSPGRPKRTEPTAS